MPGKGLQKEQENVVVKSNFLHTLHFNDLTGPIILAVKSRIPKQTSKDDYEETKTINDTIIVVNKEMVMNSQFCRGTYPVFTFTNNAKMLCLKLKQTSCSNVTQTRHMKPALTLSVKRKQKVSRSC